MSRTIRNKTYIRVDLKFDYDLMIFEDEHFTYTFWTLYRLEGRALKTALIKWHSDWYKAGVKNYKPKALRQPIGKRFRIKNNRETRTIRDVEEFDYETRTKPKLPYWD